jgi:hypothetical protein
LIAWLGADIIFHLIYILGYKQYLYFWQILHPHHPHTQKKKKAKTTYAKAFIENKWPKVTKL